MEKVQEREQTTEVFENDIALYLQMFCEDQGIEDMKKESQSVWNACLMYIKRHVFNTPDVLKISKPLEGYNNNNIYLNNSNCNSYDIDRVNGICDYYIYICNMYDKGVTITGFSKLTGINQDTIHDWGNEINKLSTAGCEIYKKLSAEYENSLESKLWSNKNPVAHMAIANKRFGWNMPGVRDDHNRKPTLSAADLPRLNDKQTNNNLEIVNDDG